MNNSSQLLFQVDLHHFIEGADEKTNFELADEFGISLRDVKNLKKKLNRN